MDTSASSVAFISPHDLAARMGRPDAPLLLDVRRDQPFRASLRILAGSRHCNPEDVAAFAVSQPARDVVVYCVYGHSVSADAARALRAAGWSAQALAGGIEGGEDGVDAPAQMAQWRAHAPLSIAKRSDLGVTGEQVSRWITRERPKIDRIACPWLVLRFIDPQAEFHYARTPEVLDQARRLGAIAYDIPGAPISHEGDLCSFDTLLKAFGLQDRALDALARIVRGADTDRLELAAQSAGLLAFSLGLSRLHADDHTMLAAALPLYDALYAWCQGAPAESHGWNPAAMAGATR